MKKIYFIRANKTKFGGGENYLTRLSKELSNNHIQHEIINSIFPKFLFSWLRAILFSIQVCLKKRDRFYFSLERVICCDIYRAGDGVHKVFMKIEKKSKLNPLNLVYVYIEKRIFKNAKKIIAISNMVKNDIIKTYNISSNKIKVIYNGIKLKEFNHESSFKKISQEFHIPKNEKILLYVGSGFKRKGVKEFLEILSQLKNKNFKAFIIGKEKNITYYKGLAIKLNLKENIIFTGPRSDVDDFYTISDIFLFPTRYEPFGNVILEAMSFSNVVITTKNCGGGEILNQKFIMQTPQDYTIVEKIDELLQNPEKLECIKKENLKIVQNFTIEKNAKETMEIINEYLY
ncbi:MAG: glycosyltransferase family 4 protein [Epsilonproteobacteria bacterium]|nr:glycosyltransferase family 4 protein [Campylobacterota bacterium]